MKPNLLLALPLLAGAGCQSQEVEQPNIILIMADDLGYGDISCFGSEIISTPNIDKLAAEGLKLTDFHSNGSLSSPTRAALMTGRYQQRSGVNGVITAVKHRNKGLAVEELTVADKLSEMGYVTGMSGKWHLGYQPKFNPVHQGFDMFKGYVAGNIDYHAYVDEAGYPDWWCGDKLTDGEGYLTDAITKNSIDFLKSNNPKETGKPVFLYIAHATPHYPYQGREDAPVREAGNKKYIRNVEKEDIPRLYKEIISVMDDGIGELMATLQEMGIDDNTIVIFCSDNGPTTNGSAGGYRGKKASQYEGGHRVPAIVRYPAKIKAGGVSDETILGMDFFPTFVDFAGGEAVENLDGVSVKELLLNGTPLAERYTFWGYGNRTAMRDGDWKIIEFRSKEEAPRYELYDLAQDFAEANDLSESNPERVAAMANIISKWREDVTPVKSNK